MSVPESVLTERFQAAFVRAFGPEFADADPIIRPSQFADLQCNAAMGLAKRLKRKPRDVAAEILAAVELEDVAESLEIAGPGFLNIRLRTDWIAAQAAQLPGQNLGIPTADEPLRAVIDYSAPNVAKEMHVGHLRTTIVGDALARTLEKLGHTVIRQNHIGDWGTPFGMLIEHLLDVGEDSPEAKLVETDPNAFYQAARVKFDDDPGFADRARSRVVTMQSGDHATCSTSPSPTTTSRVSPATTRSWRSSRRTSRPMASRGCPTGHCVCSPRGSPAATSSPSR
jgi:arginyl-tRNA synthetase